MQEGLEKHLGVKIVINNRPGAGGATGTQYLVKSKPDGYTFGVVASANTVLGPATIPSLPYKYNDLDSLCRFVADAGIVFVRGEAPWKTVEDLVADAKRRPDQITYGATTNSVSHFLMQGFLSQAGITMNHVPLQAAAETTVRILGGNLDVGVISMNNITGQLRDGSLRGLFLATPERVPAFPEIPTLREKGYKDPILTLYFGFFAPLGLPKAIRQTLVKGLEKTVKDPAIQKKVSARGATLQYAPGDVLAKEIAEDYQQIVKIVKARKAGK